MENSDSSSAHYHEILSKLFGGMEESLVRGMLKTGHIQSLNSGPY